MVDKPKPQWREIPKLNRAVPSTAYEAEIWLSELALFLKDHRDYDLAKWLAEAIERRAVSGSTLEAELGLRRPGPGAPAIKDRPRLDKERRRRLRVVSDAHRLVAAVPQGKKIPWKKIASQIGFSGTSNELRKLYAEFYDEQEIAAHQIAQELGSGAKNE